MATAVATPNLIDTGDDVSAYARAVLDGFIPAAKPLRQACARHVRDLEAAAQPGALFYFDHEAAELAISFFGYLPHYKGSRRFAGTPLILMPWQRFIIGSLFGWKRHEDGFRRFRQAWVEVPRKNGKSTLAAGLALLLAFFDDEPAAEVYTLATKRDQAKIVFNDAKQMLTRSPHLHEGPGGRIEILKLNINQPGSISKLEPLGQDDGTQDGLNVHAYIADEVHKFKSSDLLDVMETAVGARDQPLAFEITTAGSSRTSIAWAHHDYSIRILDGGVTDETWFAYIATIDEGDSWEEESTWRKANPNFSALNLGDLRRLADKAKSIPSQLNAFLRLRLNVWTESVTRWIPDALWMQGAGPIGWKDLPAHLKGRECYAGLDLASTQDLNALGLVFPDPRGPDYGFDVLAEVWIPSDAIEERSRRDGVPYASWQREGLVHKTPGNVTDHRAIRLRLQELAGLYRIIQCGYDRWGATQLITDLLEDGLAMVPMGQGYQTFAPIVREFERLVALAARGESLFRHGGNPVIRWSMANVALEMDPAGNFKFSKRRSSERIDPVVAIGEALGRFIDNNAERPKPSIYETRGLRTLGPGTAGGVAQKKDGA